MPHRPKPNFTAWFVMQGTIAAMHRPEFRATRDEQTLALYQPLSTEAARTRPISQIIGSLPYAWQYRIGSLVTHADRLPHFHFRKKEIERQARALLAEGSTRQVVVLGAGLDVLSLRLAPEYPSVKFIEIDMQESQDFKTAAFRTHHMDIPPHVEFIPGDLRNPLPDILSRSKLYDASAKTLWIAEGFFMFIPEASVAKILGEIRNGSATGSCVICTTLSSYRPASFLRHALQAFYLRKESSPYQWIAEPQDVAPFAGKLGYELVSQVSHVELRQLHKNGKTEKNKDLEESIHILRSR